MRRVRLRRGRWVTPLGIAGAVVAIAWIIVAILAPVIAPHDPLAQDLPILQPPGQGTVLGTDALGRDVFSRCCGAHASRSRSPCCSCCSAVVVGAVSGSVAGFFGRWTDETIMRITDLVLAFPTVILAMVIAAALGASLQRRARRARRLAGRRTPASRADSSWDAQRELRHLRPLLGFSRCARWRDIPPICWGRC